MNDTATRGAWFTRWFPVPAPAWAPPAFGLALTVGAGGRGLDYLTRSAPTTTAGSGVDVAGFTTWGSLFAALAALLLLGVVVLITMQNRWPVLLGHAYGVALHLSYVLALLPGLPGSGRSIGVVLLPAAAGLVHLVCVGLYIGPRPRS